MSNDDDPGRLQHQPTSEDALQDKLRKESDSEAWPSSEWEQQLSRLQPRFDDALTARTLYEAGFRAGRNDRQSSPFFLNARLLAGFATGVAATWLVMQSIDRPVVQSEAPLADKAQQATQAPPINALAEDREQLPPTRAALELSELVEQTLAKRMTYDNSSLRDRFLRGDFETVAAKPTLTYGQWIQSLNRGDMSLLE